MSVVTRQPVVMLRVKQVAVRTGLSKSTIYNKLDPASAHHDPGFPVQVRLGRSVVAWVESEVEHWLLRKMAERVKTN